MGSRENDGGKAVTASHSHTHTESFHSPLRADSPLRSDEHDPPFSTPESSPMKSPSKAIVALDKYSRTQKHLEHRISVPEQRRPVPEQRRPISEQRRPGSEQRRPVVSFPPPPSLSGNAVTDGVRGDTADVHAKSLVVAYNRSAREDTSSVTKALPDGGSGGGGGGGGGGGEAGDDDGANQSKMGAVPAILRRSRRAELLRRGALGLRVCELVFCLISFSVMAADRTQGWSGDSFDRYKEYRYCLSMAIIGFVYAGFQAYDLAYHLIRGKHIFCHPLRCHFAFFMDQALAYLLVSASSAAATRVDDWESNWGRDEFTMMASVSVAMSFLAFITFACSSVMSGYSLCAQDLS